MNLRPYLIAACCLLSHDALSRADEPAATKKETFWIIPHTHWEGAVFKTREEYLEMGLPNILKAMRLLREQPSFRFTLDQVAYVRPFLERYPAEEADFRRFLAEGRLQLTGGLDVMPDVNMPGGETFIRQMQYGKGYYRRKLGVDVTASWLIDTFGSHAQMPQLMAQAGYKSYWFVRGVPKQNHPAEFLWEGIDGTKIPAYYLPHSYAIMYGSPNDASRFPSFAKQRFDSLTPNAKGPNRVGLTGPDVSEPEEHLAPMIEQFNRNPDAPFVMRMAVPADYEAAVPARADWPVFKGELNPIFQGTYSSRIELKSWMRIDEQKLLTAEKLSALAGNMALAAGSDAILSAWEPVLFNETHDLASGVMTDHVYEDTVDSYQYSGRRADAIIDAAWEVLSQRIDTRGPGAPVVVFNTLGWPRSDIVETDAGFGEGGVTQPILTDSEGRNVPTQILESTRYADGSLKSAKLAFVARDVPAMGYSTYHVAASRDPKASHALDANTASSSKGELLENELYRVAFDPATGAMTSLRVKAGDWEVLAAPGNVVAREQDRGDFWELYKGLDGGSRVAMTTRQKVPKRGEAAYSDQGKGDPGRVTHGPVFSEFHVARPFGSGRFATRVRLYQGLRRIDITTRLVNGEKYVRYQALFPTTIQGGKTFHEIPFGSIERPNAIEFPAQNWADFGDGRHGLAVLNTGLPGNLTTDGTMMISLLRAHTLGAYGFGGGYEPGMSSDTGFQIGKERVLRYALLPHSGDWREAGVFRDGLELNHPMISRNVLPHAGSMPKRWGLLEISNPNVVVSSLKPTHGRDVALRVYEASGRPAARVTVKFRAKVEFSLEANLLEEPGRDLEVKDDTVQFDLHPYEIKTIRVFLGGAS
jgi:alpha-mannosidase